MTTRGRQVFFIFLLFIWLGSLWAHHFRQLAMWPNADLELQLPSWEHWMGTDFLGRDLFWMAWSGFGRTVQFSIAVVSLSVVWGLLVSVLMVHFVEPSWRRWVLGLSEILNALPLLLLAGILTASLENRTAWPYILCLSLASWPQITVVSTHHMGFIRSQFFVQASAALGARPLRIFFHTEIPELWRALQPWIFQNLAQALVLETTLSFLGLGLDQSRFTLGRILADSWTHFSTSPHLVFLPAFFFFVPVLVMGQWLSGSK